MLRTNKKFRFYDTSCAICVMSLGSEPRYPITKEHVFDATCEPLSTVAVIRNVKDVKSLYQIGLKCQILLWSLILLGAVFTSFAVLSLSWLCIIPFVLLCGYYCDYILCAPDGSMYDSERNVLYTDGHLILADIPDTFVYVKGTDKYR